MLEHYLTVVQLKKLYATDSPPHLVYIHEGLHPEDAKALGLTPVISCMLTVAGHRIYFQHILEHGNPVSIINFLLHGWINLPKLGGVPDKLTISPDLAKAYPLDRIIREIDPHHTIVVAISTDQSISASLRFAQENVSRLVHIDKPEEEAASLDEIFLAANLKLKPDERFYFSTQIPTRPAKPYRLSVEHYSHPGLVHIFDTSKNYAWLSKSAQAVPRLGKNMSLFYFSSERPLWINELIIKEKGDGQVNPIYGVDEAFRYKNDPADDYFLKDMRTPGCIWVDEEGGLPEMLQTLSYDTDDFLSVIIDPSELTEYLKGHRPMIWALYYEIRNMVSNMPAIIVANKSKLVDEVTGFLNVSETFELIGSNSEEVKYRLFAIISDSETLFLLVIEKGTMADNKTISSKFLNYTGEIDIGVAGLAALSFFVAKFGKKPDPSVGILAVEMLEEMLEEMLSHYPQWP